jgi:hypothetical protein
VVTESASSASHLLHTLLADPDPNSLSIHVMLEPDLPLSPIIDSSSNDSTPISSPEASPIPNPAPLRKSSRVIKPPRYLDDFHCNTVIGTHSTISSNNVYPLSSVLSYNNCASDYHAFCCSILAIVEPKTYTQASKFECWKNAMNAELLALDENKTWSVVYLPRGKVPVGCKWVYKVKYHANGSIERCKARLVAKGYTQLEGVDYFDTFSPVAKITTIMVLLALPSIKGWHLE